MRAEEFNRIFKFREEERLRSDCAPVFFAGNVKQSPFCLLGLNPAYKKENYDKERNILNERGWKQTYLKFFEWAFEKISSQYYSRFAVFLSGLLGEEEYPENREGRFQILNKNLVNLNLIPYHSERIRLQGNFTAEQRKLIRPYLKTLEELVNCVPRKAVIMNGAPYEYVQNEIGFKEKSSFWVNERLRAHIGECNFCRNTIWLDKFIIRAAAVTNDELFDAGKKNKE